MKILTGMWDGEPIWRDAFPSDHGRVLWRDTEFKLDNESDKKIDIDHDCKLESDGHCECRKEPDDFSSSDNGTGEIYE